MCERVRLQKIAELILNIRVRHRPEGQKHPAKKQGQKCNQEEKKSSFPRKHCRQMVPPSPPFVGTLRKSPSDENDTSPDRCDQCQAQEH